ncbi:MAG: TonB-dependent receptor [Saprospiraceae bacterium]|nr:TonB-dependent receptor [Saprospiraceae bacterium]MDW8483553.1 TonB-dependent receptor [Saprospiraceae bacterium]
MKQNFISLFFASYSIITPLLAQVKEDSLEQRRLEEVAIRARKSDLRYVLPVQGTYLLEGKKNEVITVTNVNANIAEKVARQVFAKIPGVFVYDMDGTGNQIHIATRGLDPHRSWEFNVRTNGILTNSDLYGYPASHFTLPFEAVERIELVRGTSALQYGAQFGGMLNYVIKRPDTTRAFSGESFNSIGSFGMISTYNAIGGRKGRWEYYAFYSQRSSKGYRKNSESNFDGQGLLLRYEPSSRLLVRMEILRSYYRYRIPGPLTDAQFAQDPRQATRFRNYYSPYIILPSLSLEWKARPSTVISASISGIYGARNSVLFDRPATIRDTINPSTLQYSPRQVDIDDFNSRTFELRLLHNYALGNQIGSVLTAGAQYIHNDLRRRQQGRGTTGLDYDLSVDASGFRRDLWMRTRNLALFLENKFQITRQWSITPGARIELGQSRVEGNLVYLPSSEVANTIERNFPLFGVTSSYTLNSRQILYGGWSQSYRPVLLKDVIPANPYERTDPNIRDSYGYNLELGWRGSTDNFRWDISAFQLRCNYRFGNVALYYDRLDTVILWRTNIGNSVTNGLEIFAEYGLSIGPETYLSVFTATSWMDAKYLGDSVRVSATENRSIAGKRVESVPQWITRNGINLRYKTIVASLLYSYTAENFADPLNTVQPNATGAVGLVPAYSLLDFNFSWQVLPRLGMRFSANNVTNTQYFNKRPTLYPGPGVWPADGRTFTLMMHLTF